jgi:signal transduction histidine kinase
VRDQSAPQPQASPVVDWDTLNAAGQTAVVWLSESGEIRRSNQAFAHLVLGGSSPVGLRLPTWIVGGVPWITLREQLRRHSAQRVRLSVPKKGEPNSALRGELIESRNESGEPRILGLFVDATELEHSQSMLARNARLEALVSLTCGVAHDFNNLLTVLGGNLALAAEDVREQVRTFSKIKAARDAATRGGELIRQLLAFARQGDVQSELIRPTRIIERIAPLLDRAIGPKIKLLLEMDQSVGQVYGNAVQLESAVVNLAVNAKDVLPDGGTVRIQVVEEESSSLVNGHADPCIRISVSDDGPGMPQKLVGRVFEPFFTTKKDLGGTGLGLSMVDAYARQLSEVQVPSSSPITSISYDFLFKA